MNSNSNLVRVSIFFLLTACAQAQLLTWNTFGNLGTETSEPSVSNNSFLSSSSLTLGAGVTAAANGNRFGGSGWFDTGNTGAGNTLSEAIAGNSYIEFIVTPLSGAAFTPTGLVFTWDRSSSGPSAVTLRSSADSFASDLGSVTGLTVGGTSTTRTITISALTDVSSTTTFRLYGTGATGTSGTGGFDNASSVINVELSGTAIPEPSTYAAICGVLALVGTVWHRRRQRNAS